MRSALWIAAAVLAGMGSAHAQSSTEGYEAGLRERSAYEAWFASLAGDAREGAYWWSGQRSLRVHGSCSDPALPVSAAWREGCLAARGRLDAADVRRHTDQEYRTGWNSYPSSAAPTATLATRAPVAMQATEALPDNHCLEPDVAGMLIDEVNAMRAKDNLPSKVIDIEQLVTASWQPERASFWNGPRHVRTWAA